MTVTGFLFLLGAATYCELSAFTSRARWARTGYGKKYASFLVDGEWTEPEEFFTKSMYRDVETRRFALANPPSYVRLLTSESANSWGFWKLQLTCDCAVVLAEDPNGIDGTPHPSVEADSEGWEQYWMGGDGKRASPYNLTFDYGASLSSGAASAGRLA